MILTEDQANQVWKILVETCGASDDDDMICQFTHAARTDNRVEFRFQGKLGFGGKVYILGVNCIRTTSPSYVEEPPRVSCYSEDNTPERADMIAKANEQLCLLWGDWESEK